MTYNAEQQSPIPSLCKGEDFYNQFSDSWECYKFLLERKRKAEEGIAKLTDLKNISEIRSFFQNYWNYCKNDGRREEKSAHEILKLIKEDKGEEKSAQELLKLISSLLLTPPPSSPEGEENIDDKDDKKLTDEEAASIEKNEQLPKDQKEVNNSIQDYKNIIWATADQVTRQLLSSEPQPSTSAAAARASNCLNYSIKRNMYNDDQKTMDAEAVSIENNQKQKEHPENTENTKVNVKAYPNLELTSSSGSVGNILSIKLQQTNTALQTISNNTIEHQINNDDQVPQELKDGEDLSTKNNLNADVKKTIITVILKPNIQSDNSNAWITSAVANRNLLDSESQWSTSTGATYPKREISNDVVNYHMDVEDLSINSNQQLKDDPKIVTNVNSQACIGNTLTTADCATRQSLSCESQPASKRIKCKTTNVFLNGKGISIENKQQQHEYPKITDKAVILGPNGTEVTLQAYDTINWTTTAGATRQLLDIVFSNDVLATHTLTGKPSPAFYGRERPEKMRLNPEKIADVIHCIRTLKNCSEREVRAAITTKCSDASKKHKRHSLKQIKSTPSP